MTAAIRKKAFAGLFTMGLGAALPAAAQFTPGNVVVVQVGDGTATLANTGNAVFLKEFTPAGGSGISVAVPTTGAGSRLVLSGTATSEGALSLSTDSLKLVFAGYDTSTTNALQLTASSTTAATIPRVVDTVSILGVAGRAATTTTAFSGNNIRAAVKTVGENYWAVGGNTGVQYMGTASAPATVFSAVANIRVLLAQNGKLYFSTGSGLSRIGRINSQPTSGTVTADTLITLGSGTTPSPYGIAINAAENVVYVADDRSNGAGGVYKWVLSNGTWSVADTLSVGASTGARGLAVNWSGTYPTLFATTTDNKLVRVIDSAFAAGVTNTPVVLATAPTGAAFRGVAFAPRCTPPAATATAGGATAFCPGGSVTLSATAGSGLTYQWFNGPTAISGATSATYSASAAGSYAVQVTSTPGCSALSAPVAVTLNAAPAATITAAGPVTFCTGGSVVLNANTGTGLTYQWYNGTTPVATTASITATTSGSYTVKVTNSTSCATTSAATVVTVNTLPTATITAAGATTVCQGDTVTLNATTGTGYTYQWYNGTTLLSTTTSTLKTTVAGSYTVTVSGGASCSATSAATNVTVNSLPTASYTASLTKSNDTVFICPGSSVTFTAGAGTGNLTYQWRLGSTTVGAAGTYTASQPGSYTLVVTNTTTQCAGTAAATKVVRDTIPTAITFAGSSALCAGDSLVLSVTQSPATTYQWFQNGTAITGAQQPTYAAKTTGAYSVQLQHTTASGVCSFTSSNAGVSVTPTPQPVVTYSAGVLSASGTYSNYVWKRNGTAVSGATAATYTPTLDGSYTVTVDSNGCTGTSAAVTVSGLGIEGTALAAVRLFPNPAASLVQVQPAGLYTVQVKDLQGRVLLTASKARELDLAPLADGIYMATVTDAAGMPAGTVQIVKAAR